MRWPPCTAGRDHHAVALLPRPQCRRLDTEHAGDRADRIDRPVAQPAVIVELGHEPDIPGSAVSSESRPVSSRSLITQRDGLMISSFAPRARHSVSSSHEQPEPGGIDEASDPSNRARHHRPTPTRHARTRGTSRGIEFAEQSQPAAAVVERPGTPPGRPGTVQQQPRKKLDISSTIVAEELRCPAPIGFGRYSCRGNPLCWRRPQGPSNSVQERLARRCWLTGDVGPHDLAVRVGFVTPARRDRLDQM